MDDVIGVFIAIIALAAVAVIVSKRSQTAKVVGAVFSGFNGAVRAAVSPVTK